MRFTKASLIIALFASTTMPAFAATTAEDAAKIQKALEPFFGKDNAYLKIVPSGDEFKATIDFTQALLAAKKAGTNLSMSPIEFSLKPEGGGKWRLQRDGAFELTMKADKFLAASEKFENMKFEGVFDEALGTFSSYEATGKGLTLHEEINDPKTGPATVDGHFDEISLKMTGTANPTGGVDIKATETIGATTFNETMKTEGTPFALQFKMESATADITMTGARTLEVLGLIKFLNNHTDEAALKKDQKAFKSLLSSLVPGFGNINMTTTLNKLEVQTPFGPAGVSKLNVVLDMNGAVKDGKFQEKVGFEGLTVPASVVPAYATSLVPKNFNIDVKASGFDNETPLKAIIDALDLTKNPSMPDSLKETLMAAFLPTGKVDITLGKSTLSNDTFNTVVEGSMSAGPAALPTGKAHVTAKGLDAVMKVIQEAPPEAGMQSGAAIIVVAKGLGKAETDGSMSWDVESGADGKVTVNGVDVNKLKP